MQNARLRANTAIALHTSQLFISLHFINNSTTMARPSVDHNTPEKNSLSIYPITASQILNKSYLA